MWRLECGAHCAWASPVERILAARRLCGVWGSSGCITGISAFGNVVRGVSVRMRQRHTRVFRPSSIRAGIEDGFCRLFAVEQTGCHVLPIFSGSADVRNKQTKCTARVTARVRGP